MSLYPVILCGGAGTRLWPASHPARPKQFAAFVGERSLFQETALRVAGTPGVEKLLVVAGQAHDAMIATQLEALELGATVLLEPEARDSAPANNCVAIKSPHFLAIDSERQTLFVWVFLAIC